MSAQPQPLQILYLDEHLVAINKPSGLLVHRSPVDRHEERFALQLTRDQLNQRVYPVHRLDKPTSGVLLFALNPEVAKSLAQQFESSQVRKQYLAITRGYVPLGGIIDHPINQAIMFKHEKKLRERMTPQTAVTFFHRLALTEQPWPSSKHITSRYSLVALYPKTGRQHQLRRHMKHISHPIIGDTRYGKSEHNKLFIENTGSRRLLLAATQLKLWHPLTGADLTIEAPLQDAFLDVIRQFGWEACLPLHSRISKTSMGDNQSTTR